MTKEPGSTRPRPHNVKTESSSSKSASGETDTRSTKSSSSSASARTVKVPISSHPRSTTPYCPLAKTAFIAFLLIRLLSALFSNIVDCDEVFNYWEPTHYLQYGYGMQTWEYSPTYAIKSWAYIQLHALIGNGFNFLFNHDKVKVFYAIRVIFAVICSICETLFYRSAVNNLGPRVGRYLILTMLISAGMWNASIAYLPSTFAMYTTMIAFFYALKPVSTTSGGRIYRTIFWVGLGSLLAWPFSAAVGIPAAIEELVLRTAALKNRFERIQRLIVGLIFSSFIILTPLVLIDYIYYKKFTIVSLNIVMYNIFGGKDKNPDIFGTEPWHFYILNGFLNFNFLFFMALISIPGLIITYFVDPGRISSTSTAGPIYAYLYLAFRLLPFYLWLVTIIIQPHKEERFLFIVYPLICLNSAVALFLIRGWLDRILVFLSDGHLPYARARRYCMKFLTTSIIFICGIISFSHIAALYVHYGAPMTIYKHFYYVEIPSQIAARQLQVDLLNNPINLCIGKEWYRFPSHYFLPEGVRLRFLKSDFNGQLPKYFLEKTYVDLNNVTKLSAEREGTWTIQEGFNNYNLEEVDRYFNVTQCDYIIDLEMNYTRTVSDNAHEESYITQTDHWSEVICRPFLDAENSNSITRAFYLPPNAWQKLKTFISYLPSRLTNSVAFNTLGNLKWGDYCLLRRKDETELINVEKDWTVIPNIRFYVENWYWKYINM
ncbi:18085_t:CDS:10 [Funneliformis geosporum]|uniref:Mannosyltransferase n=1 Tax=Funneliformis geosporum TaxID=1117311 RepID=A0A9W4SN73_9GLOM|nr:18085_t:CDS:10 [Funneliformis geosporum]CAI2176350.1 19135_t:CDS:10 [Funneliformis geosporum]